MSRRDQFSRVIQMLAAVAVLAGWLYMLAFTFHNWTDRVFLGGLTVDMPTAGILFDRWRWRGDGQARVPFFIAAAAFAAALIVGSISPRAFVLAGCIAALGAVAAWSARAAGRGERVPGDPAAARGQRPGGEDRSGAAGRAGEHHGQASRQARRG